MLGCGGAAVALQPEPSSAGSSGGEPDQGTSTGVAPSPATDVSTGRREDDGTSTGAASSSSTGFVDLYDCDIFEQDCPPGFKCNPYSNDGSIALDASRCVPLAPDPDLIGEICTGEPNGQSGLDSCELGAVCQYRSGTPGVDTRCIELCSGTRATPGCQGDASTCFSSTQTEEHLCLPRCGPFAAPCPDDWDGWSCLPATSSFICAPFVAGSQALGQPCEFVNECAPGLLCAPAGPSLCDEAAESCCQPLCDMNAPDCPEPTVCQPGLVDPLPGYEHLGVCTDP